MIKIRAVLCCVGIMWIIMGSAFGRSRNFIDHDGHQIFATQCKVVSGTADSLPSWLRSTALLGVNSYFDLYFFLKCWSRDRNNSSISIPIDFKVLSPHGNRSTVSQLEALSLEVLDFDGHALGSLVGDFMEAEQVFERLGVRFSKAEVNDSLRGEVEITGISIRIAKPIMIEQWQVFPSRAGSPEWVGEIISHQDIGQYSIRKIK